MTYNPLCLCSHCQAHVFKRYAPSALGPERYEKEAKMREERKKLKVWNEWVKGENR